MAVGNSKEKGNYLYAVKDILPGEKLVIEQAIYFYDQKRHKMNGLQNCPYCKDFYTADFYNEYINFQDKTEPSSFHLISEICQKDYFL